MSLHKQLINILKDKGTKEGYALGERTFPIPGRKDIVVDVSWERENEIKVWEVELKANYSEKLFKFHLIKESHPNVDFGLVVQREDSRRQVLRVVENCFSKEEKERLQIVTINELTGKSIEELPKYFHPLFWVHRKSPKMCVALFSPTAFEDGFNRGLRLTGIYLKEQRYGLLEIQEYLIWLAGRLGLPEFEVRNALRQIARENFPSCKTIQKPKKERGPHILKLGDLNIKDACAHCAYRKK